MQTKNILILYRFILNLNVCFLWYSNELNAFIPRLKGTYKMQAIRCGVVTCFIWYYCKTKALCIVRYNKKILLFYRLRSLHVKPLRFKIVRILPGPTVIELGHLPWSGTLEYQIINGYINSFYLLYNECIT